MGWPRIGHTPPWDLKRLRNAGPLARPLFWALRLWEWAFYTGRRVQISEHGSITPP